MALTPEEQVEYQVDSRGIVAPMPPFDAELDAMRTLVAVLTPLDDAARGRVLGWSVDRFAGKRKP